MYYIKPYYIVHDYVNDMEKLYKLSTFARKEIIAQNYEGLDDIDLLLSNQFIEDEVGEALIENFIGYFQLPMGFVTGMPIDGKLVNTVLAVEESSVIAALNHSSKLFRNSGTIETIIHPTILIGQIAYNKDELKELDLLNHKQEILIFLKKEFSSYFERGGSIVDIESIETDNFITYHIMVDPLEAMGANLITQICERSAAFLESAHNFPRPLMCILSNSSPQASVTVKAKLMCEEILGKRIAQASALSSEQPMRASTHNKGIINAIDPLLIVSGNDWRANNALLHSYACKDGRYGPLSKWSYKDGILYGEMSIPLQVGVVGGATKVHPFAKLALNLMEVKSKDDLQKIIAVSGLLQNFSALRALVSEGIIAGHMKMHLDNISGELTKDPSTHRKLVNLLQERLKRNKKVSLSDGKELLQNLLSKA